MPAAAAAAQDRTVRPGIEVLLADSLHLVRGRRVGLITNHTGRDRAGRSTIDLLHEHPEVRLVALFSPEHGIRGTAEGGERVAGGRDARTGLPVHSLYGETRKPTPAMLRGLDVLLFDIQDVGARPYTYVWTMAFALEAAAERGLPFVVLDRPNPITGAMEGPLLRLEVRDSAQRLTGAYPVPLRHGMTAGEIARYVNGEFGLGADLTVVPAAGWTADRWFDEAGLPWVDPSPNIRSLEAALLYSGLVLLEGVDVSVGRGTEAPFSYVGAPWLDARALVERLRARALPGVAFEATTVVPRGRGWVPFRGRTVHAVRLRVTDRDAVRPVLTALTILSEIHRQRPLDLGGGGLLQMLGSREARDALARGEDPRAIADRWAAELEAWRPVRERYRIYPRSGREAR